MINLTLPACTNRLLNPDLHQRILNWLEELSQHLKLEPYSVWMQPLIHVFEEEVTLEWWYESRALTIYLSSDTFEYIKVWGPNIFTEMEDGSVESPELIKPLWSWLFQIA